MKYALVGDVDFPERFSVMGKVPANLQAVRVRLANAYHDFYVGPESTQDGLLLVDVRKVDEICDEAVVEFPTYPYGPQGFENSRLMTLNVPCSWIGV